MFVLLVWYVVSEKERNALDEVEYILKGNFPYDALSIVLGRFCF